MGYRAVIQDLVRKTGYQVVRFPLMRYFQAEDINVVLDVGANRGQYAQELRKLGYQGSIISFEPVDAAFEQLATVSADDALWTTVHTALGSSDGEVPINVSSNTVSSSILEVNSEHQRVVPESRAVETAVVPVRRLDAVFGNYARPGDRVFLKIDTQGYELEVLRGATGVLEAVSGLQLELSLSTLYEGQPLVEDIIAFLRDHQFAPVWFLPGFKDPETQRLLQVDGLFLRDTQEIAAAGPASEEPGLP